ncbi:hypothetical protein IWX78_000691 [Mycetocola sp. CAN_C7]|uniref:ice-binding family protein n=1 Tax=Mycetocola sp. CAN_C7 TaxID=2787724 RepID=UPI0018CB7B5B
MTNKQSTSRKIGITATTGILALGLFVGTASIAHAATVIDGPIDLGAAADFGVLGSSTVTNTGPSVVNGDVGVSAGTSITGFTGPPDGLVNGTIHSADAVADQAQTDLTAAIVDAASLTPTTSGLGNLSGLSLTPGVYSGGALSINSGGLLTLAGTADSVWVFQAASTLTIGSTAQILITGGASSCNVFWQIGSSATIGTNADFVGTVMANASVTANTGAEIQGRLLADTGAVTLDTNLITVPEDCDPASEPVETDGPEYTSETPPDGIVGTPYSHTFTASGTPAPTYSVTSGEQPLGLTLDSTTGELSGTPTAPGSSTITVTATNGTEPEVSTIVTIAIAAPPVAVPPVVDVPGDAVPPAEELPPTGTESATGLIVSGILVAAGLLLVSAQRSRSARAIAQSGRTFPQE